MTLTLVLAGAALVLSGGTVIDGYGTAPIPDGIVVIEGDRILAVGGPGQVAIPEGAEVVSTEGMSVLPGWSATKPIPNRSYSCWLGSKPLAEHDASRVDTRKISPLVYSTHATALRSTDIENGVPLSNEPLGR